MTILPSITFFAALIFLLALLMNLVRKNTTLVWLYLFQSLATGLALVALASAQDATGLFIAAILTLATKAIMAPAFLLWLIRRYSAHFSASSYLSLPLSLLALAGITAFSYSFLSASVPAFSEERGVPLLIASVFIAFFLMINRRGALAPIVGILALENGIVLIASVLGVEHSLGLEVAIAFDIAIWIAIAAGFLTMMYRQFGTLDAGAHTMTHLIEE